MFTTLVKHTLQADDDYAGLHRWQYDRNAVSHWKQATAHFNTRTSINWSDISISFIWTTSYKFLIIQQRGNKFEPLASRGYAVTCFQVLRKILNSFIWNWTVFSATILKDIENQWMCDQVTTMSWSPVWGHSTHAQGHWLFS